MVTYSIKHWSRRIPEYLASDWAKGPTPFAKLARKYFPKDGCVLELGAGAGQDGLWFAKEGFKTTISDAIDIGFPAIKYRAHSLNLDIDIIRLDVTQPFDFANETFDAVYAQLSLHYFDDEVLEEIMQEISRILKPGGIFACMMNSTKDPEYNETQSDLIKVGDLTKRYFTKASFTPFVRRFKPLVFDEKGQTPKDDMVNNSGMVEFIGAKV